MFRSLSVKRLARVIHLKDGQFVTVLGPGTHTIWTWGGAHEFLSISLEGELKALEVGDPIPADYPGSRILTVAPHERLALRVDGVFRQVLGPGRYRWWDACGAVDAQRYDLSAQPEPLSQVDSLPLEVPHFCTTRVFASPVLLVRDGQVIGVGKPGRYRIWEGSPWQLQPLTVESLKPLADDDPIPEGFAGTQIIRVTQQERAALRVNGVFKQVLGPGRYRWWDALGNLEVLRYDLSTEPAPITAQDPLPNSIPGTCQVVVMADPVLLVRDGRPIKVGVPGRYRVWDGSPWAVTPVGRVVQNVSNDPWAGQTPGSRLITVAVHERVATFLDGIFLGGLVPGRYLWWDAAGPLELVSVDIREEPTALPDDDRLPSQDNSLWTLALGTAEQALVLCKRGLPYKVLPAGRYRTWTGTDWSLKAVPLSLQSLDVAPQDLLTQDQVPIRIKPAASVRVRDPLRVLNQPDWLNQIYLAVQLAMREVVSARTLEALLEERESLTKDLAERARGYMPDIGMILETASVKDIILPGEIKELLNRVTLAKKEAEALAIKRREETATTRQLANTARLLENNPVLLRLKELEALNEIASRIDRITLVGSGDLVRNVMLSDLAKQKDDAT